MGKKCVVFSQTEPMLNEKFGSEISCKVIAKSQEIFNNLCSENKNDIKAVKQHTEKVIFPCISMYKALLSLGIDNKTAVDFLDYSYSKRAEKGAKLMASMLKFGGLYKKYPSMFKFVAKNQFGEKAGFKAKFYDLDKNRCKFDMTKCLYCDVCNKYKVPELIICFCHTDDVNNANLHENLCWNRSKTMGEGADFCDFDIFVTDKKQ